MSEKVRDDLERQWKRQGEAAVATSDAAQEFARAANGTHGRVMPAPMVYGLLGDIKLTLWRLKEVTDHLPDGIAASLNDPRLAVYDRDLYTGDPRDSQAQAQLAAEQLIAASRALRQAADGVEAAQVALNSQGFEWREPASVTSPEAAVEVCPTRQAPQQGDSHATRPVPGRTPTP